VVDRSDQAVMLVTGAGGGIGASLCLEAARRGWHVAAADLDADAAHRTAAAVAAIAGEDAVIPLAVDVADERAVDAAFTAVESHWGPVTSLVNNAGFADQTPFLQLRHEDWMREFDVMVSGAIHGIRRALPGMAESPGSAVVNVASVNALGFYSHPTYSAAKAALLSLTGSLAALFGHTGVRINAVAPGTVLTPAWGADAATIAERTAPLLPYVPLGRLADPVDVTEAVLFLLSPAARHITGTTLPIDGGLATGILPMAHHISGRE